jgi:hypothetical protein
MSYPIHTIDLPADLFRVQSNSFRLTPEGEFSTGQWAPTPRSTGPRFDRWTAKLDFGPFTKGASGDLRFKWEVFVARLRGTAVAFRMWDPLRVYPRGVGAGIWNPRSPNGRRSLGQYTIDGANLIDGIYHIDDGSTIAYVGSDAARYADALHITGLVPSATVFKAGDHIEVGGNLYMIMDDALSDANGETTVLLAWRLWKPALVGDQVNLHKPTGRFVLLSPDEGTMQRSQATGEASIQAIEVPYLD